MPGTVALPIGAGEPRTIATGAVTPVSARWFPDGRRLVVAGTEANHGLRLIRGAARLSAQAMTFNGTT